MSDPGRPENFDGVYLTIDEQAKLASATPGWRQPLTLTATDHAGNLIGAVVAAPNYQWLLTFQGRLSEKDLHELSHQLVYVCGLAIVPDHRRRGLGSALVAHVEEELRRADCRVVAADYEPGVPALAAFWAAAGYDTDPTPNRDLILSFTDDDRKVLMRTGHGYCTAIKALEPREETA